MENSEKRHGGGRKMIVGNSASNLPWPDVQL